MNRYRIIQIIGIFAIVLTVILLETLVYLPRHPDSDFDVSFFIFGGVMIVIVLPLLFWLGRWLEDFKFSEDWRALRAVVGLVASVVVIGLGIAVLVGFFSMENPSDTMGFQIMGYLSVGWGGLIFCLESLREGARTDYTADNSGDDVSEYRPPEIPHNPL